MAKDDPMPRGKPILCVDFDGCIHLYMSPWKGIEIIPDPPVPGAMEWLSAATEYFDVHIYSSRSMEDRGIRAMSAYIVEHAKDRNLVQKLTFSDKKPRAFLTIDDRCICFRGDWSVSEFNPKNMLKFKPWNKK